MRNSFFILLLFSSYFIQAQIQGEATYLVKYEVDFVLDKSKSDNVEIETHRLYTGSELSYYSHEANAIRDSLASDKDF